MPKFCFTNIHLTRNEKVCFAFQIFITFPVHSGLTFLPSFSTFTRDHTTESAAISANNGKPEKPQAGKNPFQHALLSKLENCLRVLV
jgi:hypothetical protein